LLVINDGGTESHREPKVAADVMPKYQRYYASASASAITNEWKRGAVPFALMLLFLLDWRNSLRQGLGSLPLDRG